jgi:hypothetical protein
LRRLRRFLFFSLAAAVVGLAVGVWLLWPCTAITRDNVAKIRKGMTRAEVEAILGGPARNEENDDEEGVPMRVMGPWQGTKGNHFFSDFQEGEVLGVPRSTLVGDTNHWISRQLVVRIDFDSEGRVAYWGWLPVSRADSGPLDMIRRWLHL